MKILALKNESSFFRSRNDKFNDEVGILRIKGRGYL